MKRVRFMKCQRKQLLKFLKERRDRYSLYSAKWLEYNDKYLNILFNEKELV